MGFTDKKDFWPQPLGASAWILCTKPLGKCAGWSVLWSVREEGVQREKQAGMSCFNGEIRAINYNGEESQLMGKLERKRSTKFGLGGGRGPRSLGFCWVGLSATAVCGTRVGTEPGWLLAGPIFDHRQGLVPLLCVSFCIPPAPKLEGREEIFWKGSIPKDSFASKPVAFSPHSLTLNMFLLRVG